MNSIIVKMLRLAFTTLFPLIILQNTVYAVNLNPDEWEWKLLEVKGGHTYQGSIDAGDTEFFEITEDFSDTSTGSITVVSSGYLEEGQKCEEEYAIAWNVPNALDRLPLVGDTGITILADATGTGTILPNGRCQGSYDSLNSAGGIAGLIQPLFLEEEPEKWSLALLTTGSVVPTFVHGFAEPHSATGTIAFPYRLLPEESYPDYASFQITVRVANDKAGTVEYMAVYIYERVKKEVESKVLIESFTGNQSPICSDSTPRQYEISLHNAGSAVETITIHLTTDISHARFDKDSSPYTLAGGESAIYQFAVIYPQTMYTMVGSIIASLTSDIGNNKSTFELTVKVACKLSGEAAFLSVLVLYLQNKNR